MRRTSSHLVVLAGGLASRFGGDKAFTPTGPDDEYLLEYALLDARRAAVPIATLVVPPGRSQRAATELGRRVSGIELRCVEQDKLLPYADLATPARERPWGTAHAASIGCSLDFDTNIVVNADDWYGPQAITTLVKELRNADADLMTWPLASTLSEHGAVNRGLCRCDDAGWLQDIRECIGLLRGADGIIRGRIEARDEVVGLAEDTPVSLNVWALGRPMVRWLQQTCRSFISASRDDAWAEAQLPTVIMEGMRRQQLRVRTHRLGEEWAGITFHGDLARVRARLERAAAEGTYPQPLWSG